VDGLTEGRIVHYVLNDGQHRAAIVVRAWGDHNMPDEVNLYVFLDGANDKAAAASRVYNAPPGMLWVTSVRYDATGTAPHSWHWPEQA
jgi:hypothetical protein